MCDEGGDEVEREKLGSRMGFIFLSAGCAIGIGNVWRFPYIAGLYGGGVFVLFYLFFLIAMGVPVMTMEFAVGRASRRSIIKSFTELERPGQKWHLNGYLGMAGNYLLMMFYTTVAGWMLYYFYQMLTGKFTGQDKNQVAEMFGFIRNEKETAVISNRIFETVLYNFFISEEFAVSKIYSAGVQEKNQFIVGGHLDVRRILEKFVETFDYLYGEQDEAFMEEAGRRYFLLFLKPIINGIGNYSIEPETRNSERMDLVIYYGGEQYICELKIWRGNAYNERGEEQLCAYLDHFHLKKGYMLSFNFNKKKKIGVKEITVKDKVLIEAVV